MFYSRASEALFLFIQLLLAGSVAFGAYPSKQAVGGIIKRFSSLYISLHFFESARVFPLHR